MCTLSFRNGSIDAGLVEDLKRRGLKCGAARIVMGRGLLLDDPWPYAVTEEFARGEKARGTRADDEDLGMDCASV